MVHPTAAAAALVAALALSAPTAQAATAAPTPLTLERSSITAAVSTPQGQPVLCDGNNFNSCGVVSVTLELSGFAGRERPGPGESLLPLFTSGTVDVTRVYGCASAKGRRLHRYDTKVVQRDVPIQNRFNFPFSLPDGDSREVYAYGLLDDAQPGNCPTGTSPRLYRLVAGKARVTLESQWDAVPASHTYVVRGQARWNGSAPTPAL